MHKRILSSILLLTSICQPLFAANEIECPSVTEINKIKFTQAMSPLEGDIFATSELLQLDSNHIWSVVIHGLQKADIEEANEKIKFVDIRESEFAVPYHSNLFDSLACDYHISEDMSIKVHAVIATDNSENKKETPES